MATFTSAGAFTKHIGQYAVKVAQAEDRGVKAAALAATQDIRAEAKGFHIGTKKLGARYEIAGSTAVIQARGPWGIVEKGSRPHAIRPKRRGGRGRRAVVVVPGRGVFAHVSHPGHGSIGHPWEQGVAKAKKSAPEAFKKTVIKSVFG
jgi:hypothetical protein